MSVAAYLPAWFLFPCVRSHIPWKYCSKMYAYNDEMLIQGVLCYLVFISVKLPGMELWNWIIIEELYLWKLQYNISNVCVLTSSEALPIFITKSEQSWGNVWLMLYQQFIMRIFNQFDPFLEFKKTKSLKLLKEANECMSIVKRFC